MKFVIDLGHGGSDPGAAGIRKEVDLIKEVADVLIPELKELGHEVFESRPVTPMTVRESLRARVTYSDKIKPDLFVSIHFNASKSKEGNGTEVFAISSKGRSVAQKVVDNICKFGFRNRGVKDGNRLYVVRRTQAVAILIEVCFIDNQIDIDLYNKTTAQRIAEAILNGIIA